MVGDIRDILLFPLASASHPVPPTPHRDATAPCQPITPSPIDVVAPCSYVVARCYRLFATEQI